jgi:hypothetical protein
MEERSTLYKRELDVRNTIDWIDWLIENVEKTSLELEQLSTLKSMISSKDPDNIDLAIELIKQYTENGNSF